MLLLDSQVSELGRIYTTYGWVAWRGLEARVLPPCSMSESVRCVREKLAIFAGVMEKRE